MEKSNPFHFYIEELVGRGEFSTLECTHQQCEATWRKQHDGASALTLFLGRRRPSQTTGEENRVPQPSGLMLNFMAGAGKSKYTGARKCKNPIIDAPLTARVAVTSKQQKTGNFVCLCTNAHCL